MGSAGVPAGDHAGTFRTTRSICEKTFIISWKDLSPQNGFEMTGLRSGVPAGEGPGNSGMGSKRFYNG